MAGNQDIELFTLEDQKHIAYRMCVAGHLIVGGAMGSLAGGMTVPGAIGGGLFGVVTCKYLAEPIRRKLFSGQQLTDGEFRQAMRAVRQEKPAMKKHEVLDYLASTRMPHGRRSC